jgi:hypothetical protein
MKAINKILKTQTGRKMIANLSYSNDTDMAKLSEYSWIDELPLKQQELFDTIYQLLDCTRVELAFKLINHQKI